MNLKQQAIGNNLRLLGFLPVLMAAVFAAMPSPAAALVRERQLEPDSEGLVHIAIRRAHGLDGRQRSLLRARSGVRLLRRLTLPDTEVVAVPVAEAGTALAKLRQSPGVVWAELDRVVMEAAGSRVSQQAGIPDPRFRVLANDPGLGYQWGLSNFGQTVDGFIGVAKADARVRLAWNLASGSGVTVAVVDGGIDASHVDLAGRLAVNPGEIAGNGVDDDRNGFVDDVSGWDFVDSDSSPANASAIHGTHVAGVIAARRNNREGIAGAAPLAKLLPLRALGDDGTGRLSDVAAAFDYAGEMGVPVVNASLGGPTGDGDSQLVLDAVKRHPETLFVVAAGNAGASLESQPFTPCIEPASNIICIGASDQSDARLATSNWSPNFVDLFAPGARIISLAAGGGTIYRSGTSMATPLVSAAAALAISAGAEQRGSDLRQLLMANADSPAGLAGLARAGRLNALRAVRAVRPDSDNDGIADASDACPSQYASSDDGCPVDTDADGLSDDFDNCPSKPNAGQADADADGIGDICDSMPRGDDLDGDRIGALDDNCPSKPNALQLDSDQDGIGNVCDPTPLGPDLDLDGVPAVDDNCTTVANEDQADTDSDRIGDACDPTPRGPDADSDGLPALDDRCPSHSGPRANRGCPWPKPKIKRAKLTRRGSAWKMTVIVDASGSVRMALTKSVCRRGKCKWVTVGGSLKAVRAGKSLGIDLGKLGKGRYRVLVEPTARSVVGTSVTRQVKVA